MVPHLAAFFVALVWKSGRLFILYIDGSGSVKNPNENHFVLAGVAVPEGQIFHLIRALDDLVGTFGLGDPNEIELHGSPMYNGRGEPWKSVNKNIRLDYMTQVLNVLNKQGHSTRTFGVAVNKQAIGPQDPVKYAFEEICNRFNFYLTRLSDRRGGRREDRQRGLIVMDESQYEQPLQALAKKFRRKGARWGKLRNLAEVPLFVDSEASRLIQLADMVAFSMWRKYEHADGRFFDSIIPRFDQDGGVIHGLVHAKPNEEVCYCPACMSRQGKLRDLQSS